jgi:hypothetical protein
MLRQLVLIAWFERLYQPLVGLVRPCKPLKSLCIMLYQFLLIARASRPGARPAFIGVTRA